jgi:hypothetical protein
MCDRSTVWYFSTLDITTWFVAYKSDIVWEVGMLLPTDQLSVIQRVKSFPALHRAERSITVFRRAQLSPKDGVDHITY